MKEQVNRLGFEAWADNLIVNVIENLGDTPSSAAWEDNHITINFRFQDGEVFVAIRAYLPGQGWQYHDRLVKLKK